MKTFFQYLENVIKSKLGNRTSDNVQMHAAIDVGEEENLHPNEIESYLLNHIREKIQNLMKDIAEARRFLFSPQTRKEDSELSLLNQLLTRLNLAIYEIIGFPEKSHHVKYDEKNREIFPLLANAIKLHLQNIQDETIVHACEDLVEYLKEYFDEDNQEMIKKRIWRK